MASNETSPDSVAPGLQLTRDERYRVLAESAPDAIVTIAEDGVILSVNPATERIFGYSERELVGQSIERLMPERMRGGHHAGMARYLTTGRRKVNWRGVRVPGLTSSGREIPLEISFGEFLDGERHIFSGFMRDVSEQAAQRETIERTTAELERALAALKERVAEAEDARRSADEANAAKAQFLRTMSHELRTPLNAIGGFVDLLDMEVRGPVLPAQREDLMRIRAAQQRLLTLVNDVLSFARLEERQVEFALERVAVASVLCALGSLLEPQLRAREIVYECVPPAEEINVTADPQKVEQILLNLLSNAVKFSRRGGHVWVTSARGGSLAHLVVRDDGPGIPADRLEAIFEPFVQVDSALTRAHDGTGLGLAISRDLARGMGGDISVVSRAGSGATFTLTLPLAADAPGTT